ncbi:MAG: winged helix-turn-helix domain-containing protein [bacterium]
MNPEIGDVAGKVWNALGKRGELSVAQLPLLLKIKGEMVYQGLGWLAREGKVQYRQENSKNFVSLAESELSAFNPVH